MKLTISLFILSALIVGTGLYVILDVSTKQPYAEVSQAKSVKLTGYKNW
jgi:hypothetical protein